VQADRVSAQPPDGVLRLGVPKPAAAKSRRIEVSC
jgi:HSP20 family molecular chaperone IbpA